MTDANSHVYEAHFVRTPFQLLSGLKWKKLVAFRVDEEGVLLGGAPARYEAQLAHVPWGDITSVVVWHQRTAGNGINYIGVQRKPGAPALRGMNSRVSRETAAMLAPMSTTSCSWQAVPSTSGGWTRNGFRPRWTRSRLTFPYLCTRSRTFHEPRAQPLAWR